jgi:organic radical activating enzyme
LDANLVEIFSSVQGEGPDVGASTLFVRLGECDLRCRWCDSPHTWQRARECRIEVRRGAAEFRVIPNPVPLETAVAAARALEASRHRFVSLTGGEPLLQPEATAALARELRALGPAVHLETHGLLADALMLALPHVDVVSMDWKLASDVRRAGEAKGAPAAPFHAEHEAFLARARAAPRVVVKIVVTPASEDAEIDAAVAAIARSAPAATLVLQPVTPHGPVRERPAAARMLALAARAESSLRDVRVIPQTHPIYGAL